MNFTNHRYEIPATARHNSLILIPKPACDVLMGQPAGLQVDENETFQDVMVKHEVDEKPGCLRADMILAADKGEPLPRFKEELPELADERLPGIPFEEPGRSGNFQEFKNIRIPDKILRLPGGCTGS